ncbi:MAG: hypothetical protein Q9174_003910, partial [Haloplaca sp. 1 TL-2023]
MAEEESQLMDDLYEFNPKDPVVLQVGDQKFYSTAATLFKSKVLEDILTTRETNEDGSYLIDADPGLFGHIIRFLRH